MHSRATPTSRGAARFLLVVKACFGGRTTSLSFGYGLAIRANFSLSGTTSLIVAARDRLDGVIMENPDFVDAITRNDSPRTLFYCDTPYIGTAYACKFPMDDHTVFETLWRPPKEGRW